MCLCVNSVVDRRGVCVSVCVSSMVDRRGVCVCVSSVVDRRVCVHTRVHVYVPLAEASVGKFTHLALSVWET